MPEARALLLRNVTVPGQGVRDVLVTGSDIAAVGPPGQVGQHSARDLVLDLSGHVLLPAGVEPHAHLDKALLVEQQPNLTGDLAGAIVANRRGYASATAAGIRDRALRALRIAVRRGFTLVRTHVNVEDGIGLMAAQALRDVAAAVSSALDLELVALSGFPLTGTEGGENRRLLEAALELGVQVVGGAPALDARPHEAVDWLVGRAAEAGRAIDLHLDETLDAEVMTLRAFAKAVEHHGLGGRATASHCVSLGQQDPAVAREVATMLRDVGVSVVVLPQSNLMLQARGQLTRALRATAPAALLREQGVRVIGGGDNWRDMFNPLGRIDPLETAALMAAVCHLPVPEAYACVSTEAAVALERSAHAVVPGAPAELLAVRAGSLEEAVADASEHRTVIHRGAVVSRTAVTENASWQLA